MKKVALYCRVSTALQEQEKTIGSQLAELKRICKDFKIAKEYIDDGWSGETLDRPALEQLRNDAKEELFEAVCVLSIDRLSRNLHLQGILVEELKKRGIEIFIGDKAIEDTPEAELLFNLLGAVAQYEKEKILERTKRGKMHKARKGIVVGTNGPFGYDYVKKTKEREGYYQINPGRADIVKLIFNLYLGLSSVCGLAKELTNRGIKPPKGIAWRQSSLQRILRDESYVGTTYYNKTQAIEGKNNDKKFRRLVNSRRRIRDKNEWIPIPIPPILDKGLFMAVQDLLKKNHRANNQKYLYLLDKGLMRCTDCGHTFSGAMCHGYSTYRCNNRARRFPLDRSCKAPQISCKKVDEAVWTSISEAMMNPKIIISHIKDLGGKMDGNKKEMEIEKQGYLKEQSDLEKRKGRLLDIFTEGTISKKDYSDKIGEFTTREEELNFKISELENKSNEMVNRPLLIQDIGYFCNLAQERLNGFDFQEKQRFLRYLVDQITLDSKKRRAKIAGRIPVSNNEIMRVFPVQSATDYIQSEFAGFAAFQ